VKIASAVISVLASSLLTVIQVPAKAQVVQPPTTNQAQPNTPQGTLTVLGLERNQSPSKFRVTVSTTDDALVSCVVRTSVNGQDLALAKGSSWVYKNQTFPIQLESTSISVDGNPAFKVSCIPRFLADESQPVQVALGATPRIAFEFQPEPPAVTVINEDIQWDPSFPLTQLGSLKLVFDDAEPGMSTSFDTKPSGTANSLKLQNPMSLALLQEGKYYRYHFEGTAGNERLAQQSKIYVLVKDTKPRLQGQISLTSQSDGIHIKIGLTRRVSSLELRFPNPTIALHPVAPASSQGGGYIYEFLIPSDIEGTLQSNPGNAVIAGINKSLYDVTSTSSNGSQKPAATGTLPLTLLDLDGGQIPLAQLELSVVRISALDLLKNIAPLSNKLGLSSADATAVANKALGITGTSTDEEKRAAAGFATVLQQKGQDDFKNKLISFLIVAGKVAARSYGIPIGGGYPTSP
jgi:hypothetical protein